MKIIGHQNNWRFLKNLAEIGNFSHAFLFCGREHLGKKTIAVEFLKLVFGKDISMHSDFNLVEPLENEIQISQIRDLNWKLSLKPFSAPFKAAIIDKAHLMNQEAQNCFLKTLEEPKGKTVLILISEYPELLLPTIRSRVQKVKFYPVGKKEIENYLTEEKRSLEEIKLLSEISMGRPGIAIDFISDPQKLTGFKKRVRELTAVLNSDLASRFQYAKDLSEAGDLKEILNIWLDYFRNILLSNLKLQKNWMTLKKDYTLEKLKIILKNIQTTIFLISTTNINQKLALELLLMEI
ncbi:MAG: hypothetical protein V1756_02545 [Patescibacteria group bacterium]